MIGVSTHTLEEARRADDEGASYILFGPVFAPLSKTFSLPARGLVELERVCRGTRVPVFALGGITEENAADCERGEWAFRDGKPCTLGAPVLVHYEQLHERPEPHFVDS